MNDVEFAHRILPRIGELYAQAKRSRVLYPEHTLGRLRGLANLCCDLLRGERLANWPDALDEKIDALVRAHHINPPTRAILHDLRRWGNAAAHPEQSLLDPATVPGLASRALDLARTLLETVFREQHAGAALPAYDVVDDNTDELRDVCYRALLDGSAPDQYEAALLLRRELAKQRAATSSVDDKYMEAYMRRLEFGALEDRALDLLRYASDSGYPAAHYAYGLSLSQGRRGDDMIAHGANLIAMASRDGDIDAMAWCGNAALYGLHDEPVDHDSARRLLETAAAHDHPLALSLLARIYREGLGVHVDLPRAFDLMRRAAEAGYPIAQYEAAVALLNGMGVVPDKPRAHGWLKQACAAGHPDAQLSLGRLILRGELPGTQDEAEHQLIEASQRIDVALLDLAQLYSTQPGTLKLLSALGALQQAYEAAVAAGDEALAEQCRSTAPAWVNRLDRIQRNLGTARLSDDEVLSVLMTRFMFDDYGRPYASRTQRLLAFADKARATSQAKADPARQQRLLRQLAPGTTGATAALPGLRRPLVLAPVARRTVATKTGRNDPCPCNSGKKFKACCA